MATGRRKAIARMLTATVPRVPYLDAEAIRAAAAAPHMRDLASAAAVWLAVIARIRHEYTEYDTLRDEGYGREEARFFILDELNMVLDHWGATRRLSLSPDGEEEPEENEKPEKLQAERATALHRRRRDRPSSHS